MDPWPAGAADGRKRERRMPNGSQARWSHYALVAAVAGLTVFWRLGVTMLDGHECLVAVPARTMAQPNHWLGEIIRPELAPPNTPWNHWMVPVLNGYPRLNKTPLAYWAVGGLFEAGLPRDEFTVRLPSALAAVLMALVTLWLGRRMFSPPAALLGALMLATSWATQWGRVARPDMLAALWMTLGMACFYAGLTALGRGRSHAWMVAGLLALGLGGLSKQIVPLFLVLPLLLYVAWRSSQAKAGYLEPAEAPPNRDASAVSYAGARAPDRPRRWLAAYLILSVAGLTIYCNMLTFEWWHWWTALGLSSFVGQVASAAALLGGPTLWYFVRCWGRIEWGKLLPSSIPGIILGIISLLIPFLFLLWMWYMERLFSQAAQTFSSQNVARAVGMGKFEETHPPGFYIGAMFQLILPWVAFVPGALAVPFLQRFRRDRDVLLFLLFWVFGLGLIFSAAVGKRWHYMLPAAPAMCLVMGYVAEDLFFQHRWLSARWAAAELRPRAGRPGVGRRGADRPVRDAPVRLAAGDAAGGNALDGRRRPGAGDRPGRLLVGAAGPAVGGAGDAVHRLGRRDHGLRHKGGPVAEVQGRGRRRAVGLDRRAVRPGVVGLEGRQPADGLLLRPGHPGGAMAPRQPPANAPRWAGPADSGWTG